jgi:hypothetical protein
VLRILPDTWMFFVCSAKTSAPSFGKFKGT